MSGISCVRDCSIQWSDEYTYISNRYPDNKPSQLTSMFLESCFQRYQLVLEIGRHIGDPESEEEGCIRLYGRFERRYRIVHCIPLFTGKQAGTVEFDRRIRQVLRL